MKHPEWQRYKRKSDNTPMIERARRKEARTHPLLVLSLNVDTSKFERAVRTAGDAIREERQATDRMDALVFAREALYGGRSNRSVIRPHRATGTLRSSIYWSTDDETPVQVSPSFGPRIDYPSGDSHSVRFSEMNEEAEKEMAEWDAILKGRKR